MQASIYCGGVEESMQLFKVRCQRIESFIFVKAALVCSGKSELIIQS